MIVRTEDLAKAIKNSLGKKIMTNEEIQKLAEYVMNFFGFEDKVADSVLKTEDRHVFYELEEMGLLTTDREDVSLIDKKAWRINYWVLNKDKIFEVIKEKKEEKKEENIYEKIPEEVWERKDGN